MVIDNDTGQPLMNFVTLMAHIAHANEGRPDWKFVLDRSGVESALENGPIRGTGRLITHSTPATPKSTTPNLGGRAPDILSYNISLSVVLDHHEDAQMLIF